TSVWIDYLRNGSGGRAAALDGLLGRSEVLVCGPVVAEILAGANQNHRNLLWIQFRGIPWTPLSGDQWHEIGEAAAKLREAGASVPMTDIAIAVSVAAANVPIWTRDSDFARINEVLGWPEVVVDV